MNIEESYALFLRLRQQLIQLLIIMKNPYPVEYRVKRAFDSSIKFADSYIIQELLERHKPATCLEIGSFLGFSSRWMLETGKAWGMRVIAVDPNMRHRIFDNPRWMVEGMNADFYPEFLEIITGFFGSATGTCWNSYYKKYLPYRDKEWTEKYLTGRVLLNGSWERKFDCIFIDGNHSYTAVMADFRCSLSLLSPGGIILFHDALTTADVKQALEELQTEFSGKAEVAILDGTSTYQHPCLAQESCRWAEGIGFFRML